MKKRNPFAGALLGIAMLGGIGALATQPALAQDAPAAPAAPTTPAAPDTSTTQTAPDTSTTPAAPATPSTPDTSATPAAPATPSTPDASATPAAPSTPDASATPAAPATPDASATPAAPATPDTSATPAAPATPDASATPATPATPDTSATPAAPATPDASATPATPDATAPPTPPATPDTTATAPATPATPGVTTPPVMPAPPSAMPAMAPMTSDTTSVAVPLTQLISPTPGDYSPPATLSTGPINTSINYHALTYKNLNENDLQVAATLHYSDRQIAKILKLSKETDFSFLSILNHVADGETFPILCREYGVSLSALKDVSKEIKQVDDYESAIAATGTNSFKRPSVLGPSFPDPGSEGSVLAETPDLNQPLPVPVMHGG